MKKAETQKRTIYRDSATGRIISKRTFDRRNPSTVERERISVRAPAKPK